MKHSIMKQDNIFKALFFSSSLLLTTTIFTVSSCSSGPEKATISAEDPDKVEKNERDDDLQLAKTKKIFYMLPSPVEMASMLQKAGATYDKTLLTNPENVTKYETTVKKAVNLGVYGADLSYTSIFEQNHEIMHYLASAKSLGDGLGITQAFNSEIIERFDKNIGNKDSILLILSDSYWIANSYLTDADRASVSALVIAGGWIEGVWLATQLYKSKPNEDILKRIAEQKYSLEHLNDLMNSYGSDRNLDEMKADLNEVKQLYDALEVKVVKSAPTVTEQNGVATVGGGSREIVISPEQIKEITMKIASIRNKYIAF